MNEKGFRYEFTKNEFKYFLFAKKNCPKCGNKLQKSKCEETVDGSIYSNVSAPLYISSQKVKRYFYLYTCNKCDSKFELNELAK